jgi:hypothetical protein
MSNPPRRGENGEFMATKNTALAKAKEQITSVSRRASAARAELRETRGVKGAIARMPATLGGAALVGAAKGAGFTGVLGAPTDIVVAVGLAGIGIASGSAMAMDAASGAASVAVARYSEAAIGGFFSKKAE